MANPSKKLFLYGFHRLHSQTSILPSRLSSSYLRSFSSDLSQSKFSSLFPSPSVFSSDLSSFSQLWRRLCSHGSPSCNLHSKYGFSNLRRFSSGVPSKSRSLRDPQNHGVRGLGIRFFTSKGVNFGKFDINAVKTAASKPLSAVGSLGAKYRQAAGLQVEAFWNRNYLVLVGAVGLALCIALWRIMFGIASTFVGLSEGMAKYGFLALASAMVAFAGLYVRSRFTINPDKIYRIAMRRLNTSAGILEIMGAPLAGTDVRAYVMSGGGPRLKNFKLKFGGKRCFLIFPIQGSEKKGLVSIEAKKKKGQYDIKMLAVDIPMASGPDQRIFLIGDEIEYKVGGGLISELRDPIVKAMAAEKEFEELDQKEEEEDAKKELHDEERKRKEEVEKLEKNSQ